VGWPAETSLRILHRAMTFEGTHETWRAELAARESNGVSVRLFWSRSTNLLTVTVDDATNGESFELVLAEHERPLEVFYHPYAYAAARDLEFGVARHAPELMVDA
jgi:hypothetical protein